MFEKFWRDSSNKGGGGVEKEHLWSFSIGGILQ